MAANRVITREEIKADSNWRKIRQEGGSYIVAYFFNIKTLEVESFSVRDYDYSDCSRDDDDLYYMDIDQDALKAFYRSRGIIQEGDRVMIVKGRKFPAGTVKTVRKIYPLKDRYNRWIADYLYFDDGTKCDMKNCILIMETGAA